MTVKESHDILSKSIDRLAEQYQKHIDNHNGDIKVLQRLVYMILGGIIFGGVILGVISFEVML